MARIAEDTLSESEASLLSKGIDVVGDIAVLRLAPELETRGRVIGEAILRESPSIKVVLSQITPVRGEYRTRGMRYLAGEGRTTTIHTEYGVRYKIDLGTSYFSPRLSFERMRIAQQVKREYERSGRLEEIVNLFAGVGCFSILIAKHSPTGKIHSIDINEKAVAMMEENVRLNKLADRVIPVLGDARQVVSSRLREVADRVLMPLPESGIEYLETALESLSPLGGWLHFQDFVHANIGEDPIDLSRSRLTQRLDNLCADYRVLSSRIVRDIGPRWYHVSTDLHVLDPKAPSFSPRVRDSTDPQQSRRLTMQ